MSINQAFHLRIFNRSGIVCATSFCQWPGESRRPLSVTFKWVSEHIIKTKIFNSIHNTHEKGMKKWYKQQCHVIQLNRNINLCKIVKKRNGRKPIGGYTWEEVTWNSLFTTWSIFIFFPQVYEMGKMKLNSKIQWFILSIVAHNQPCQFIHSPPTGKEHINAELNCCKEYKKIHKENQSSVLLLSLLSLKFINPPTCSDRITDQNDMGVELERFSIIQELFFFVPWMYFPLTRLQPEHIVLS